jgi:ADP-heptose:LPS heptosyltransferase
VTRVCIVLLTGLGDVVHGLPIVNAIKRAWPGVHITWVVEPMPSGILRPHPSVDEIVIFHKHAGWRGVRALWTELRQRRFDLTLNLNVYFKSIFPTIFSRAPRRLGFNRARARDAVWLFCNERLPPRPRNHTQEMFLEFLDVLQVPREPLKWRIPITKTERAEQLIIAPDTGPVHIARALEVPVIGLYGHTNPWRVGPFRKYQELWIDKYTEPDARPDPSLFDPKHGRMEQITVDAILEKVKRVL